MFQARPSSTTACESCTSIGEQYSTATSLRHTPSWQQVGHTLRFLVGFPRLLPPCTIQKSATISYHSMSTSFQVLKLAFPFGRDLAAPFGATLGTAWTKGGRNHGARSLRRRLRRQGRGHREGDVGVGRGAFGAVFVFQCLCPCVRVRVFLCFCVCVFVGLCVCGFVGLWICVAVFVCLLNICCSTCVKGWIRGKSEGMLPLLGHPSFAAIHSTVVLMASAKEMLIQGRDVHRKNPPLHKT